MKGRKPPFPVILVAGGVVLVVVFWAVMCCYLGPTASPTSYQKNLNVRVVSFDDGAVGEGFLKFLESTIDKATASLPGFEIESSDGLTPGMLDVSVHDGDAWAALYVTPNATQRLAAAIANVDLAYDPTQAIVLTYDEGRSYMAHATRLVGPTQHILHMFTQNFAANHLQTLADNSTSDQLFSVARTAPSLLAMPVAFRLNNIHPLTAPVTITMMMIGMIFVMVFSMITSLVVVIASLGFADQAMLTPIRRGIIFGLTILSYTCALALSFTVILSVFNTPFENAGKWISFWLVLWLAMMMFGLLLVSVAMVGGIPAVGPVFFLLLVLNASGGLNTLELSSPFFRWAYAMPLFHLTMACRTLLYGSYNRLSMNIPVLAAWLVVAAAIFCFACKRVGAPTVVKRVENSAASIGNGTSSGDQVDYAGSSKDMNGMPSDLKP